jgi:hypothetical protein
LRQMIPSWEGGVRTGPYVRRGQPNVASLSVLGLSSEGRERLSKRDKQYEAARAGTAAAVPVPPPRPARSGARGRG